MQTEATFETLFVSREENSGHMDEKERFFSFILKIINIISIRDLTVIYVPLAHSLFRININTSS